MGYIFTADVNTMWYGMILDLKFKKFNFFWCKGFWEGLGDNHNITFIIITLLLIITLLIITISL